MRAVQLAVTSTDVLSVFIFGVVALSAGFASFKIAFHVFECKLCHAYAKEALAITRFARDASYEYSYKLSAIRLKCSRLMACRQD